jgi:ketosteroid isomerase-like protein
VSQENVEIVRSANAAFNRGDRDAMFAHYHHDVELRDLQHAPDAPEQVRGIEAVGSYMNRWVDAVDDLTAEIEEYIDAGRAVVTLTRWRGTAKGSDLVIDLRTADVLELADGRIIRVTIGFADRAAALEAVGMED